MQRDLRHLLGMAGVPPHDNPRAYDWEKRLHWIMVGVALLAIPAFYLEDIAAAAELRLLGWELDAFIFGAFSVELLLMLSMVQQRRLYLRRNWLNLVVIAGSGLGLVGTGLEWVPVVRLLRLVYAGLILARLLASVRRLLSPSAIPSLLLLWLAALAVSGGTYYWLEPSVASFGEGLWLAFTTSATVGYGDLVPTTPLTRVLSVVIVLIGYSILSLVTASIAAIFIGEDERLLRREMHGDIKALRQEITALRQELEQRGGGAQAPGAEAGEKSDDVT
jgi:voltage-gated potassium channel